MSVSQKQTVEIVKVLYRGADTLILDEPTAVPLTPQETEKLFNVLRNMRADGKVSSSSPQLHEVMSLSDQGRGAAQGPVHRHGQTSETNPQALTDMMVGHAVTLNIDRPRYENPVPRLTLQDVTWYDNEGVVRLDHVSFTAMGGEILGVAGIAGSGQRELLESIAGLYPVAEGSSIRYTPEGARSPSWSAKRRCRSKVRRRALLCPRRTVFGMGLVGSDGHDRQHDAPLLEEGQGRVCQPQGSERACHDHLEGAGGRHPSTEFPVRRSPAATCRRCPSAADRVRADVLMSAYAVRGRTSTPSYTIYNLMTEQKMKGVAVIFVGEDLDVLLELCDRILVLCGGKVSGIVDARTATKEEIG